MSPREFDQLPPFKPTNCDQLPLSEIVIPVELGSNTSAVIEIAPPENEAVNSPL